MHIYVGNKTQYKRSCRVFRIYMYRPIYLIGTIIRSILATGVYFLYSKYSFIERFVL